MALTGKQFAISAGDYSATAVEIGGGLRRCTYAGADVLASYGEDELPPKAAGSVLTPWPNRLRGGQYTFAGHSYQLPITEISRANATHGLARWIRWAPMAVESAAVALAVDIPPQAGWPFELRVELTYALHPDRGLAVTAVVRNQGATAGPQAGRPAIRRRVHRTVHSGWSGSGRGSLGVSGRPAVVRRDVPLPAGVHHRRPGRRGRRGDRADDLPGRRLQLRFRADRARP